MMMIRNLVYGVLIICGIRQTEESVELSRLMERCLKESRCVDLESLCIVVGEKVTFDLTDNDDNDEYLHVCSSLHEHKIRHLLWKQLR